MQAMQTAEMLKEGAKVVPGLGKEIEKGSVIDKLGGE
jgi:hypothetical protein